jgi:hypothetical protein
MGRQTPVSELEERVERAHRRVARGRSAETPIWAHAMVITAVAVLVGVMLAVALVFWLVLR